jgi:hypothetical protein
MDSLLRISVLVTGAWALLALVALVLRARSFGKPEYFARPAGRAMAGVAYAFGPGLSPTAKESTREHLPTYFAGVGYHAGILAGLAYLVLVLAGAALGDHLPRVIQALCLLGSLCGAGLLIKRLLSAHLRGLSCPDDYAANVLTTGFVALACASASSPALTPAFLAEAAILMAYVPLGKIRHCCFFFPTRYYLGAHFGRRGTFPPRA